LSFVSFIINEHDDDDDDDDDDLSVQSDWLYPCSLFQTGIGTPFQRRYCISGILDDLVRVKKA